MTGISVQTRTTAATLVVAAHFLLMWVALADDYAYEVTWDLKASEILPAGLLEGEHHSVDDNVRNDGYLNYYIINSEYGVFEAASTAMLRIRVREIHALAELDELSKTEVFIKAAADAGVVAPLRTIKQFATHPVKTVTGIPRGIGRMFKRYSRQAGDAVDSTKDAIADDDESGNGEEDDDSNAAVGLTERFFGVTSSERAWAAKLGTDPYSSNEALRAAIKSVAWTERLGRFGVGFAGIPEIPGVDIIGDVSHAVWSKDPYELQDLNRARLVETGADEELIEQYLESPWMSPSQQTLLTAAIAEMTDVQGRGGILQQALISRTEAEAGFFIKSVALLAWYHLNQEPFESVLTNTVIPAGITTDDKVVLTLAVDHVYWTDDVAEAADNLARLRPDRTKHPHEIWMLGTASPRSREELSALGFIVHEDLAATLASDAT
jgi:hypothetical protein